MSVCSGASLKFQREETALPMLFWLKKYKSSVLTKPFCPETVRLYIPHRIFPFSLCDRLPPTYCSAGKLASDWLGGDVKAARSICYWITPQRQKNTGLGCDCLVNLAESRWLRWDHQNCLKLLKCIWFEAQIRPLEMRWATIPWLRERGLTWYLAHSVLNIRPACIFCLKDHNLPIYCTLCTEGCSDEVWKNIQTME